MFGRHKGMNARLHALDRKSTRLNSSHGYISYAVFCLKKKNKNNSEESPPGETRHPTARADVRGLPRCPCAARAWRACVRYTVQPLLFFFFFFNDTATTEIYTLSLHDALPI